MVVHTDWDGVTTAGPRAPRRLETRRERRWRPCALFFLLFLVLLVAVGVVGWTVITIVTLFVPALSLVDLRAGWAVPVTLAAALLLAVGYWVSVQLDGRRRLLAAMHAQPPDPQDRYHQRLLNIVEELRLATGLRQVEATVVPTSGLNAFAFSDLRGGGIVGVTEGALARLSRAQLEAVMAHEFAHLASGSSRTVTLACLLFAVFADDEQVAQDSGLELATCISAAPASAATAGLIAVVGLGLLKLGAAVVNGALSRERESEADLAAATYVGDPLSLAQALRLIGLHGAGGGFIPPALASLCIRGDAGEEGGWLDRRLASHPPLDQRIDALLALANVSRRDFEAQARRLERLAAEREHWDASPAWAAGGPPATSSAPRPTLGTCPACAAPLVLVDYEGVRILACGRCGGRWVRRHQLARIIARREVRFTEQQQVQADEVVAGGDRLRHAVTHGCGEARPEPCRCPGCGAPMLSRHVSYQDAVGVEYCGLCDAYWFAADQLEVLQVLAERRLS